jgi:hypothetical protein
MFINEEQKTRLQYFTQPDFNIIPVSILKIVTAAIIGDLVSLTMNYLSQPVLR